MRDVLNCLQHNQVSWKKQAPYNLKCRKAIGILGGSCGQGIDGWSAAYPILSDAKIKAHYSL